MQLKTESEKIGAAPELPYISTATPLPRTYVGNRGIPQRCNKPQIVPSSVLSTHVCKIVVCYDEGNGHTESPNLYKNQAKLTIIMEVQTQICGNAIPLKLCYI